MASQKSISELATLIQNNTKILEDGTKDQPGGDFSLAFTLPPPALKLNAALEAVRREVLEAVDELRARLLGPFLYMGSLALPVPAIIVILSCLYRFDIAANVPTTPGASITYEALAQRVEMPADDLRRVLQTAIAYRIFEEAEPDASVRHNAVSAQLALVPGLRDALALLAEDNPAGAARFVDSVTRHPGSGEPGHSALMLAERAARAISTSSTSSSSSGSGSGSGSGEEEEDPSKGLFALIADDPARVARFRGAMGMSTRAPGYSASYFLDSLAAARWADPARCPRAVVDVGGAGGDLCRQMLRRFPAIESATVLDLPEVVAGAAADETTDAGGDGDGDGELAGRLRFAAYDFLAGVPVPEEYGGADAYVLRHIFHDWSDLYAVRILRNLAAGLKPGARVWVSEVVLPPLSGGNHLGDQRQRGADLMMKVAFNGKERSRRGWEAVLAEADPRFRIESIVQPEGAIDSVIEIVFGA